MNRRRDIFSFFACALLAAAPALGQGPASCGYHLDIRANGTGTHSAVADMPNGPGSLGAPIPIGSPGNPYSAYATPGSPMSMIISGNPLAFGPAPVGAGSCATIFYSFGPPPLVPFVLPPPFVPPCAGAAFPSIIGVLPIGGAIIDTCGFITLPPPPFGLIDVGGGRMVLTGGYPLGVPPISFQAAGITPGGAIWVTNSVTIFPGPNPFEVPVPFPVACGAAVPLDDGQSVGNPVPPGFTFYGFPTPPIDLDTNGFADFAPGPVASTGCDLSGALDDFGCAPVVAGSDARPRIDVNHLDYSFAAGPPAAPFVPGMTMEFRPPGPSWPDAMIYRWKNVPPFGSAAGIQGLATACFVLELQGGGCPATCVPPGIPSRIVVVRSWFPHSATGSWFLGGDQVGIGPGLPAHGFGGPPPAAPTCTLGAAGLAMMGTYPPFPPFFGVPGGAIHMDTPTPAGMAASAAVANSAIVFTPLFGGPAPLPYSLVVY